MISHSFDLSVTMSNTNESNDYLVILRCRKCCGFLIEKCHVRKIENPSAYNKSRPRGYFLTGLSCWGAGYSSPLSWFDVQPLDSDERGKIICPHNCGAKLGSWDYTFKSHCGMIFFAYKAVEEYIVPDGEPIKRPNSWDYNPPGYNSVYCF